MYFIFYTGDYIPIKISTDRINWKESGKVFKTCPEWFKKYVPENDGKNCWAPDISYREGKYWLYYSVSTFGSKVSAIGLATTPSLDPTSPDYKWTDEDTVMCSNTSKNYNCIDPNIFSDSNGKIWMNYGSWNSGIKMVELNPESGKLLSPTPRILSLASRNNNSGIEASFIINKNGFYYLFVSWDNCCKGINSNYNIRVGRATKVTGPYNDKSNVAMKNGGGTLIDRGDERWIGPGHNGIYIENDTVFLINHAYDAKENGNPKLMIRPLYWDNDVWPTLDASKGNVTGIFKLSQPKHQRPKRLYQPILYLDDNSLKTFEGIYTFTGRRLQQQSIKKRTHGIYITVVKSD